MCVFPASARQAINDLPAKGDLLRFCDSDSRACEVYYRYAAWCVHTWWYRTVIASSWFLYSFYTPCTTMHPDTFQHNPPSHRAHQAEVESAWWKQQAVLYKKAPAAASNTNAAAGVEDTGVEGRFPAVESTWEVCVCVWGWWCGSCGWWCGGAGCFLICTPW